MQKLVYIFFAMLAVVLVPSCRTTTEIHHYDTLTVERNVVQLRHDTVTIDSTKERIITEVIYDTIGRPYKVTKVEWRNKYITEQGAVEVVHDTITVQQGSKTSEIKTKRNPVIPIIFIAGVLCALSGYIYYKIRHW